MTTTTASLRVFPREWTRTLLRPLRRDAWRVYLFFLLAALSALAGVVYLFAAGMAAALLLATLIGVPLVALIVLTGRGWNRLYRRVVRLTGVDIEAPPPFDRRSTWWATIGAALTDPVGWRSLGFVVLHSVLLTPLGFALVMGAFIALTAIGSPAVYLVTGEPFMTLGRPVDSPPVYLLLALGGLIGLYTVAWAVIGVSGLDVWLARSLLGATDRDRRVRRLERARSEVADDAAATLRRVERDLHDGTQARLITVAMALARAEEHFAAADTDRARALVCDALANTKETIAELRDIVRGIRPPALDLGLDAAVQTLAARAPVPVDVSVDLGVRPSLGVETMAYFCVAELLANVSRHSAADRASVSLRSDPQELRITVADNGSGGVRIGEGSGLTGLRDRLAMLDGTLSIDSPDGGPTVVTVTVPLGARR